MTNLLLIPMMTVGIIEAILVFTFWFIHVRHHKTHPVYRIRHPIFWMVCLCAACFLTLSRSIGIFLYFNDYISFQSLYAQQILSVLLFGINFPLARIYFLFYSLKLRRYQQSSLIKRHLKTEQVMTYQGIPAQSPDSEQDMEPHYDYAVTIHAVNKETNTKQPYFYAHSNFFGNPKRIFVVFESIMLCLFIVFIITTTTNKNPDLLTLLTTIVITIPVLTLLITEIILLCSLWLCSKSTDHESLTSQKSEMAKQTSQNTTDIYHGKKFRDDFRFRLEALLMTIVYLLMTMAERTLGSGVSDVTPGTEEYNVLIIRSVIITALGQTIGILVQVIVPYYTLKQNLARFTEKRMESTGNNSLSEKKGSEKSKTGSNGHYLVSLLDVLSHKYGFFLFMDHLVQELSFENLAFLIEVYQYKFIEIQDMVREYRKNDKLRSYFRKGSSKHKIPQKKKIGVDGVDNNEYAKNELQPVTTETTQNASKSMNNLEMSRLEIDTDTSAASNTIESSKSGTSESDPYSLYDEYSAKKDFSDSNYYSLVLNKMPWHGLPLNALITSTNDKLIQAEHIYTKYIDRDSYDSVNCSYDAVAQIRESMRKLILWTDVNNGKGNDGDVKMDVDTETEAKEQNEEKDENKLPRISKLASQSKDMTNVSSLALQLDLDDLDNIKDEKQWNEILLKVFDAALPDIFANLEDSMMRFRYTKEFKSLIGAK